MEQLAARLPAPIGARLREMWERFEARDDRAAKLAKLADVLEAQLFFLDEPEGWNGWSERYFRSVLEPAAAPFPELEPFIDGFLAHVKREGYYDDEAP